MGKPLTNGEIDSLLDNPKGTLNDEKKLIALRKYYSGILMSYKYFITIIEGNDSCNIDVSILRRASRVRDLLLKSPIVVEPKDEIEI